MAISFARRKFVACLGGVMVAWPLAARTQQVGKVPRIGMVFPGSHAVAPSRVAAVLDGLREAGYLAPAQVELVLRIADGDPSRFAPLVAEIIASNVDVFYAFGPALLQAVRSATQTVPIVAVDLESDPVDSKLVASLAHPGGNVTGIFLAFPEFTTKWIELLKETIPGLSRVAVLWDPSTGSMQKKAVEGAAESLKVMPEILEVQTPSDFDGVFNSASQRGVDALLMLSAPVISTNIQKLAELAVLHSLPAVTLFPDFARAGGLMAYGPDPLGLFRQAGIMTGKVLQGTKAADLPIERPTKFELVVNAITAKALRIVFPTSVLLRADEVIE
jgi:putative ABC transport system substrate-binding protein